MSIFYKIFLLLYFVFQGIQTSKHIFIYFLYFFPKMLWRTGGWSTVSGTSNFFDLMWGQFWPYLLCFCLAGITWMCGSENEWGQYYGMVCTWLAKLMVKWWPAITGPLHYVAIKGRVQTKWNFHKSILFILNSENTFFPIHGQF